MLLLPTLTYSRKILQYTICMLKTKHFERKKTKQNTKIETKKTQIFILLERLEANIYTMGEIIGTDCFFLIEV